MMGYSGPKINGMKHSYPQSTIVNDYSPLIYSLLPLLSISNHDSHHDSNHNYNHLSSIIKPWLNHD